MLYWELFFFRPDEAKTVQVPEVQLAGAGGASGAEGAIPRAQRAREARQNVLGADISSQRLISAPSS